MKLKSFSNALCMMLLLLGVSSAAAGREPPVAKMLQIQGKVEYTRNEGASWRPIRRTKYLFPGFVIKTGADGSGKLINQGTGMSQDLGPNSEIKIEVGQVTLVSGSLTDPKQESASIFEGLSNKFAKAQRYTTVRRGSKPDAGPCDTKVRTKSTLTVSPAHGDLVWRNACPEYSYKLVINDEAFEIPAQSTAEMIRFSVAEVPPGEHSYRVEVMDNDGTVYIPRKDSKFTMIDADREGEIMGMLEMAGDDIFVKSGILESEGMYVASMDNYRAYFAEFPDDNDMRPLLIQSYQDLKLSNLRESEARLYNASIEEEE
jgi:hypothetical protein